MSQSTREPSLVRRALERHRYLPLRAAVDVATWLGVFARRLGPPRLRPLRWRPGVSIAVLRAGAPAADDASISSVLRAAARIAEPWEVVHAVDLAQIARIARHDAVYVVDGSATLEEEALCALLPFRAPQVCAISSRVVCAGGADVDEPGWPGSEMTADALTLPRFDAEGPQHARGIACPSRFSTLYHRRVLQRAVRRGAFSLSHVAGNWELGLHAWCGGHEVLRVPTSIAHASPVPWSEVEQLASEVQFVLRHRGERAAGKLLGRRVQSLPEEMQSAVLGWRAALRVFGARWRAERLAGASFPISARSQKHYPLPRVTPERRSVAIVVTPFRIYPAQDAGAIAIARDVEALRERFDVVLLSDEGDCYGAEGRRCFDGLASVHLVDGRREPPSGATNERLERIRSHSRPELRRELERLIACHRPALVQIEHVELALLIDARPRGVPFVLRLRAPLPAQNEAGFTPEVRSIRAILARFDGVIDWGHPHGEISTQIDAVSRARWMLGARTELGTRALALVVRLADRRRARSGPAHAAREACPLVWKPGVTVLIPERGRAAVLAITLESVEAALADFPEPAQVVVVVNGSPRRAYEALSLRFARFEWLYFAEALGFGNAVRAGLLRARFDGVYLLNSDMRLAPDALRELLPWRTDGVAALASQVHMADASARREETGWTVLRNRGPWPDTIDALPESEEHVRGAFYAGGGASLFHRSFLLAAVPPRDPYHPFYGEDLEWGTRAWRTGCDVLFVPRSKVWHQRRGTIAAHYAPCEVERILRRNLLLYQLRNARPVDLDLLRRLDPRSRREISTPAQLLRTWRARRDAQRQPHRDVDLERCHRRFYAPPRTRADAPRVLVVCPFACFPPTHGGAKRTFHHLRALASRYRVILLSDEEELYGPETHAMLSQLEAVHLVGGRRRDVRADALQPRLARIAAHCHDGLRSELARLLANARPDAVVVELMELAALAELRHGDAPWTIDLHDVYLGEGPESEEDRGEATLIARFDAAIACSTEDAALLRHPHVAIVPNGSDMECGAYVPSTGRSTLLFAGPFRYAPNLDGIERFLHTVYPALRERVPTVDLVVLGGADGPRIASERAAFRQPGVRVLGAVTDVRTRLDQAALTINPQLATRGSSLKLIESVIAGRVCVSTRDGARGFLRDALPGLVVVERIEDFLEPLAQLLLDEGRRLELEQPPLERLQRYAWREIGRSFVDVQERLLRARAHGVRA